MAGELERRWNERLIAVRDLELEIERLDADEAPALSEADRARLIGLGQDLARAWDSPGATPERRKKIIRTVITEIIVDAVGDRLELIIHWQGGDHNASGGKAEPPRSDTMEHGSGCGRAGSCPGAADARRGDRRGTQPLRQDHRSRQQLDTGACLFPSPSI